VAVNPLTGRIYVSNTGTPFTGGTVSVIDGTPGSPTENKVVATVTVDVWPGTPAVNPTTGRVYVPNSGTTSGPKTLSVIDGTLGSPTENTVVATVPMGQRPYHAAMNPLIDRVYVADRAGETVSVIADAPNHNPVCTGVNGGPNLWPPNHKLALITLTGATDPDGDPVMTAVTGVNQDEPLNGLGDGDTSPDAQPGPISNQVYLRAERSGPGDGRVYRISFVVTDGRGGSCTGTTTVGVPHDRGAHSTPLDSGGVFVDF
jgi:DNA-binding beta-propeller fold protein YncE